jgi:hypothetical protein
VHPWGALASTARFKHLSVWLEMQDGMWAPPTAEYQIKLVNQADASKSFSLGGGGENCN